MLDVYTFYSKSVAQKMGLFSSSYLSLYEIFSDMKDIHVLHFSCKHFLGVQVTLGKQAFGQILILVTIHLLHVVCILFVAIDNTLIQFENTLSRVIQAICSDHVELEFSA